MKLAVAPDREILRQQELELWHAWKRESTVENLRPLLNSLDPVMEDALKRAGIGRVDIPPSAVRAEALKQTMLALHTYNPRRGASIATHATNRLKKLHTYVLSYQNVGRLPGSWGRHVGRYKRAKEQLAQALGREPSAAEISAKAGISIGEVQKLELSLRSDLAEDEATIHEPEVRDFSTPARDVFNLIYPQLSPQEQVVFEHTTGYAGKEIIPAGQIATRLGVPAYQVSRLKAHIAKKMEPYL